MRGLPTEALDGQGQPTFAKGTVGNLRVKCERRLAVREGFEPSVGL